MSSDRPDGNDYAEQNRAYGDHFARIHRIDEIPTLLTSRFRTGKFAAMRLTSEKAQIETGIAPSEKTWVVSIQLRDNARSVFYKDGRHILDHAIPAGGMNIFNLQELPHAWLPAAFDAVHFHLPETVLSEISDDFGAPRIDMLHCLADTIDPVVSNLAHALLPVLENPAVATPIFVDHVALALQAHLATTYGQAVMPLNLQDLVLSDAAAARAQEMMAAHGQSEIALEAIARECGLPPKAFIDAFKRKTGLLPHQWQRGVRLDRARDLLVQTERPIAEIALEVGFADQSHFTRHFTARFGVSPRAFRLARR